MGVCKERLHKDIQDQGVWYVQASLSLEISDILIGNGMKVPDCQKLEVGV